MYAANYDQYKRDMAAYKAGNKIDEEHDPAATQLQQDFAGAEPEVEAEADVEGEAEAEPEESGDESTESSEESHSPSPVKRGGRKAAEPVSTPAVKTPAEKGRRSKKRKSEV